MNHTGKSCSRRMMVAWWEGGVQVLGVHNDNPYLGRVVLGNYLILMGRRYTLGWSKKK